MAHLGVARMLGAIVAVAGLAGLAFVLLSDSDDRATPRVSAPEDSPVPSCTRIASPSGSDSGTGSAESPFRTPQRLADSLAPGQTGCLRAGTYRSSENVLRPTRGGRDGAPVTIRSYPGERAKLSGIIQIDAGVDFVVLTGVDVVGTGANGANTIKVYSRGVVIEDSDITNRWRGRSCVLLGNVSGGGRAVRPVIRRNRFHECGDPANGNHDHAVYAANTTGGEITDNVFYNSAAYAIQLYPNAQHTLVAFNVIDGGRPSIRGGLVFAGDADHASSHNTVERNVIAYSATFNITSSWEGPTGSGNVARENCVWAGGQGEISTPDGFEAVANKRVEPRFADRAERDYDLPGDAPCAGPRRKDAPGGG